MYLDEDNDESLIHSVENKRIKESWDQDSEEDKRDITNVIETIEEESSYDGDTSSMYTL